MSREIKFRCWNGEKMLRVDELVIDPDGKVSCYGFDTKWKDGDDPRKWVSDGIFMQYTGLRDVNGKEVYEGDVVMRTYGFTKSGKPKYAVDEIVYRDEYGGFYFMGRDHIVKGSIGYTHIYGGHKVNPWEVIGNVHENPELLNV